MSVDLDKPPLYDYLTKIYQDDISDVWGDWLGTFCQTLAEYLSQNGIFLPQLTTAERNSIISPINGQSIYNTTLLTAQYFNNGVWVSY